MSVSDPGAGRVEYDVEGDEVGAIDTHLSATH